jgi:2-polyprenyl-6-methoxyphenol hydroxylase-like FAD-dependent oxidoreductase
MLERSGWQVTVVDAEHTRLLHDDVVTHRAGAPHAVHAHGFMSRTRVELTTRLPDVWSALLDAGVEEVPLAAMVPPSLHDGGRPGDLDVTSARMRRHTTDAALAQALDRSAVRLVEERATGLVLDREQSLPRVLGLGLADGTALTGDLVVDAGGRRSPVSGWLRQAGIAQPERHDESIARYYSRHYRVTGPRPPLNVGFADVHEFTCHVQLMFLGDRGTAMLALAAHDADPVLKALRHAEAYDAVLGANDSFTAWREVLEPTTDVFCLGAFDNRMRGLVADGRPVVRGLWQVGDALATTNPTRGRGVSMGLMAAGHLVDVLAAHGDGDDAALAFEAWRDRVLAVAYRECATTDVLAVRQFDAGLAGRSMPANAPALEVPDDHPFTAKELERAAGLDPDLFRTFLRATVLLDDDRDVLAPEVSGRVQAVLESAGPPLPGRPRPTDGLHDRETVARLLAPWQ